MGAVVTLARSSLRRRWRALVVVALLAGIGGGATIAAVAASRRTLSALPRFAASTHPLDVGVNSYQTPISLDAGDPIFTGVEQLPGVDAAYRFSNVLVEADDPNDPRGHSRELLEFGVDGPLFQYGDAHLVTGRLADPNAPDELMLNEQAASRQGLHVGDRWDLQLFTDNLAAEAQSLADVTPDGPKVTFTVVGIVRFPYDLGRSIDQHNIYGAGGKTYATPGFARRYAQGMASYGVSVAVRLHDSTGFDAFQQALHDTLSEDLFAQRSSDDQSITGTLPAVQRNARLSSAALLVLAALVGLATLFLCGQALVRDAAAHVEETPALRAIGCTTGQLRIALVVRAAIAAVLAALLAIAVAVVASPLAPIGLARRAELHPGIEVNVAVIALGAVAVAVVVVLRTTLASMRQLTPPRRRRSAGRLRRSLGALPPPAALGAQFALGADARYATVLRTVVATIATGVAGCTAALVLLASLHSLTAEPASWGVRWDVAVGGFAGPSDYEDGVARLASSGLASSSLGLATGDAYVGGRDVPIVEGTVPRAGEVALGRLTASHLNVRVGDELDVQLDLTGATSHVRVSGIALMNATLMDTRIEPGVGVLTPFDIAPQRGVPQILLVKLRDGTDSARAIATLQQAFPQTVQTPVLPNNINNLVELQPLLLVLVGLVSLLAVGSLAHGITLLVRQRRHDLAVLRAIGFMPRQATATVAWSAATLGLLGVAIGVPVGIVAGRWGWRLVDDTIGIDGGFRTPWLLLVAMVGGVLALVLVIAAPPSLRAGRLRPSVLLRAE